MAKNPYTPDNMSKNTYAKLFETPFSGTGKGLEADASKPFYKKLPRHRVIAGWGSCG